MEESKEDTSNFVLLLPAKKRKKIGCLAFQVWLVVGVGSGRAVRVLGKFFILTDCVGFAKTESVDHPLS
jgi:hypothetical protein